MTNAQHSTNDAAAANPATALWRIAVSEYEAECVAFAAFDVRYKAVCAASDAGEPVDVFAFEREELDPMADRLSDARDKLFDTPAPDAEAFFHKLNIMEAYLAEVQSEDAERFTRIATDCRALFGQPRIAGL